MKMHAFPALVALAVCRSLWAAAPADESDRGLMSDAYWAIWNDAEQARIDADIEKNRKADGSFEVDAPDGTDVRVEQSKFAEVR